MSLLLKNLCNFTRPTRIILNNLKGCDLIHICKVSFFWLCNQPTSFTFRMLASLQGRVVFYLVQGEALLIINLNKNMTMFFLYEQYPIFLPAHFWIHNILWPARSYHELASAFVELEDSEYTNVSCSQKSTKLIESAFGMECIYLYDIDITNQKCCFFFNHPTNLYQLFTMEKSLHMRKSQLRHALNVKSHDIIISQTDQVF